jgi:Protein of unknown function (DUF559)/Transcriptional regulator, AbiEi antitoxin
VSLDREIALLSSSQHGAFSRRQALELGASNDQILRRLESGLWLALDRGTYALESSPPTWHRTVMAAVLSKNRALATGATAGHLHGLPDCRQSTPEITVPFSGNARSALARVRRRVDHSAIESVSVSGIPVSSVAETLFDLARLMRRRRLERAIDHALVHDLVAVDDLGRVLDRVDGSRLKGTVAFRESIAGLNDGHVPTDSYLEHLMLEILDRPDIPAVEQQVRLPWWEELPHRVDAVIPAWRLILEADGRAFHTKREDFERDRQRDNLAAVHGYRVMRFTYDMLTGSPDEVLRLVREAGRVPQPQTRVSAVGDLRPF